MIIHKKLVSISSCNYKASSFDTVYEWEKIISEKLNLKIQKQSNILNWIYRQIELRLRARDLFEYLVPRSSCSLLFVMTVNLAKSCRLSKNAIPIIIDFWLIKEELPIFYNNYKYCPLVLISSLEVYQFLINNNCPLNIAHWPLSLPDSQKLRSNMVFVKKWDLALLGRTNPLFIRMLQKYCDKYPDFEYVLGSNDIENRFFYTNKGKQVGNAIGREAYLEMLRATKISLYTTPGLDEAKKETEIFNQVTPRFLELISGGCLIIAHYTKNPDTDFYEMELICNDVDNYEKFEEQLNAYRQVTEVPLDKYIKYLSKHYTSERVVLLKQILKLNNITIV